MTIKNLTIALCSVFLASCSLNTMTFGLMGEKEKTEINDTATTTKTPPSDSDTKAPPQSIYSIPNNRKSPTTGTVDHVDTTTSPRQTTTQQHIVVKDDTLYSISRRYQVDLDDLRQMNGIGSDNVISVGQALIIRKSSAPTWSAKPSPQGKPATKPQTTTTSQTVSQTTDDSSKPQSTSQTTAKPVSKPTAKPKTLSAKNWVWPLNGNVVRQFNPKGIGANGIRIAGKEGQAVHAAQDGVVVYKGRGLSGYGTIVILSHNNGLLSTYGFLSKTHVQEGQKVRKRETIGTVGQANNKKLALYFEVREKGDPINPMIQIGNTYRF